ncbi:lipid-binding protein [Ascoidea rubescens DSM 1968]|uniref:Lipid-binding protein n=1 Tax=Ascoidea rubescens DSM 1968 TaxID=1344418 RepID=A0A1D2VH42_9ASCO|nr:lipid-binding protein [Ascoidea rubescens DSM 1968]ODV60919.1 lipid-binding protein [Ascoidea rubescens DSM 1968]
MATPLSSSKTSLVAADNVSNTNGTSKSINQPQQPVVKKRVPKSANFRGWKETVGWLEFDILSLEDELDDLLNTPTHLDNLLPDFAYGDWYHNVAIFILAGLTCFILGKFKFSLAPVFPFMVIFSLYYRTQIRKYRSNLREQAQRAFSIKRIENDYETMDWLNTFLDKFWLYLEPSICQIVCDQANPILASLPQIPPFVTGIWIDTLTLGTKPFRIEHVKTFPRTSDDVVVMDWSVSMTPNEISDMNNKQLKNHVNQKFVIKIKLFNFITFPIVVEDVAFHVTVRVRIRMMSSYPNIDTVNVSLPEFPKFDFVSKVFGQGIFNWEVLSVPGLLPLINDMILKFAGPILFNPFSFQLNIEELLKGNLTGAIGVLTILLKDAKDIKLFDQTSGNTIDPYLTFNFNGPTLAKSKTIEDTCDPVWNESIYILVNSLAQPLQMICYDFNDDRKDVQMGTINFDIQSLKTSPTQPNLAVPLLRNNKPVGTLFFDLNYSPVLEGKRLIDGSTEPPPELNTGIARIEINEIKIENPENPNTFVELYINKELILTTSTVKSNNNPIWNVSSEKLILDKRKTRVLLIVKNDKNEKLDYLVTSLNDIVDRSEIDKKWIPLKDGNGEIKVTSQWKPVRLADVPGASGYSDPIGVVRVAIDKAVGLRNLENVGTIDPYARILINGFQRGRTLAVDSSIDPIWNEVLYATVTGPNQKLTIEGMDVEKISADRTLGSFDIKLNEIIHKGDDNNYIEHVDKEYRSNKLVSKKGPKGTITYHLSFFPAIPVMDLDEIAEEDEATALKLQKEKEKEKENPTNKSDKDAKINKEIDLAELDKSHKLRLNLNELMNYNSGVFVYQILQGAFNNSNLYIQAFFDADSYPQYVSDKLRQSKCIINDTGDVVVKELEYSRATFRLVKDKDQSRAEDCIAEASLPTRVLLQNSYAGTSKVSFNDGSVIRLQTKFIPITFENLPLQDTILNSGQLTVTVLNGRNLISADRNGKSDPFVEVRLNGKKYLKTKTIKKTLNPDWITKEECVIPLTNRTHSHLEVRCFDWDFGEGQDDKLGIGFVDLTKVPLDAPSEVQVPLNLDGKDGGYITLKLAFQPLYIYSVRKKEGTFADGATKVFGAGKTFVGAGGKVIGGAAGVVGKGGSFVKHKIFGRKKDSNDD